MRSTLVVVGIVALLLAPVGAQARRGRGHGHGHGHRGSRVVVFSSFGWPGVWPGAWPGFWPGVWPNQFQPWPYSFAWAPFPGPGPYAWAPPEGTQRSEPPPATESWSDPLAASYGLVQLRGVTEGANVELDGRFWLVAEQLDQRWLALPHGEHRIVVRASGAEPVTRRVEIEAGRSHVVRFGPRADAPS